MADLVSASEELAQTGCGSPSAITPERVISKDLRTVLIAGVEGYLPLDNSLARSRSKAINVYLLGRRSISV